MVKRLRNKILTSIKSGKFNVFLLFFLISAMVLVFSKLSKIQTKTFTFQIDNNNLPQELVLLNKKDLKLNITLKAEGYKLIDYYFKKPKMVFDFKTLNKLNDSTYIWDRNSGFPELNNELKRGEEILSITPDTLRFLFDINAVAKIPVQLKSRVGFTQGFDMINSFKISPDTITIVGPKSVISEWQYVATDTLVLNEVNKNISKKVNLNIPKEYGQVKISDKFVEVSGEVDKFSEGTVNVPVSVKNVPEGFTLKIFPKDVTITFYTSLSVYNQVNGNEFKVECDYSKVTKDKPYLEPLLIVKPSNVKSARINQNRIEFVLTE